MDEKQKSIWILEFISNKHPQLPEFNEVEKEALAQNVVVNHDDFYSTVNKLYAEGLISGFIYDKDGWFQELSKLPAWNPLTHSLGLQVTPSGRVYRDLKQQASQLEKKVVEIELASKEIQNVKSELRSNNIKMVEVLGVFAAIISLIVVGSTIIPSSQLPPYQDTWATFFFILAIMMPFGIIISGLIALIWLFILPHEKKKAESEPHVSINVHQGSSMAVMEKGVEEKKKT